MTYYIQSKTVRDVLGKAILMNQGDEHGFDRYLHRILVKLTEQEVFILNDEPQSKSKIDLDRRLSFKGSTNSNK